MAWRGVEWSGVEWRGVAWTSPQASEVPAGMLSTYAMRLFSDTSVTADLGPSIRTTTKAFRLKLVVCSSHLSPPTAETPLKHVFFITPRVSLARLRERGKTTRVTNEMEHGPRTPAADPAPSYTRPYTSALLRDLPDGFAAEAVNLTHATPAT